MFKFLSPPKSKRRRALDKATSEVMRDYYSRPFCHSTYLWNDVDIVSLDFETTGLDPQQDQILSIGRVDICKGIIHLGSARHQLVRPDGPIPEESAIIHHITDDRANSGEALEDVLPELLHHLSGKVMLVHYDKIEMSFLNAACQRLYDSPFMIPVIDTLKLAERVLMRRNHAISPNRLRLFNLRNDFHLPRYKAHNALNDALTTAELFLNLEGEITPKAATRLRELLT